VNFLVDMGAQHSVLTWPQGKLSQKKSWVQGATGMNQYPWTTQRTVELGTGRVSHSFMVIPDCPYPLLGRDLLTKIGAHIHFDPEGTQVTDREGQPVHVLTLYLEDEYRLHQGPTPSLGAEMSDWLRRYPAVWAETGSMGLGAHRAPGWIELKPGVSPARVKQYPMHAP
jgi:hypothetical protein